MFERPDRGERALLVHPVFQDADAVADPHEFVELAVSAGAEVLDTVLVNRYRPEPKLLIGSGKVDDVKLTYDARGFDLNAAWQFTPQKKWVTLLYGGIGWAFVEPGTQPRAASAMPGA